MTDVERLLSEYKQADREDPAGADPRPYLERVSGSDRELLTGLIDAYLERAPRRGVRRRGVPGVAGGGGDRRGGAALARRRERDLAGAAATAAPALRAEARRARGPARGPARRAVAGAQGRRVLPPHGAGPAARGGRVRHRARRAGQDRRLERRGAPQGGRHAGPRPAAQRTRARCSRAPTAGPRRRPGPSCPTRRRPRSGTRSTASSVARLRQLDAGAATTPPCTNCSPCTGPPSAPETGGSRPRSAVPCEPIARCASEPTSTCRSCRARRRAPRRRASASCGRCCAGSARSRAGSRLRSRGSCSLRSSSGPRRCWPAFPTGSGTGRRCRCRSTTSPIRASGCGCARSRTCAARPACR